MGNLLDRDGTFKAKPISWAVSESKDTQSLALAIELQIMAEQTPEGWADWTEYEDQVITGYFYVVKKDGTPNIRTIEDLVRAINWDCSLKCVEFSPPDVVCQIVVETEEWKGKSKRKVKWINPENYSGGLAGATPAEIANADKRYGSLLRAAGSGAKFEDTGDKKAPPPSTVGKPGTSDDDDLPF